MSGQVVEHGRRYYRSLIFSSDASLSLKSFSAKDIAHLHGKVRFTAGNCTDLFTPALSMVITRNFYSSVGEQVGVKLAAKATSSSH